MKSSGSFRFRTIMAVIPLAAWCTPAPAALWEPMDSGTTAVLLDVWGSGPSDVFAVGLSGTILHYDGLSWTPMPSSTTADLYGVTGWSASNAVAVGPNRTILSYDGTSWSPVAGIPGNSADSYTKVWGTSRDNLYVVGAACPSPSSSEDSLVLHWDGVSWNRRVFDLPSDSIFADVWGRGSDDVFAIGTYNGDGAHNTALLYHFDGTNWTQDTTPPLGRTLMGMWGDKKNLFIGAEQYGYPNQTGMMYRLGTGGWQTRVVPIGSDAAFTDVWGSTSKDVYASGYHGAIIHYDGNADFAWTYEDTGISGIDLFGIWGSSTNDVFAVGRNGTIVHGTPAPGAALLGVLGLSCAGWRLRRRTT